MADRHAARLTQAYSPLHSRLVMILKLALPLTALALMSSVFLLASPVDPERAIPLAEIDVADRARDPRLTGARFAGVTDDGSALRIETRTARSDPQAMLRFHATGLELHLDRIDGGSVFARADEGMIDRDSGYFSMRGGIELVADPGYRLRSEQIRGALDQTWINMPETVDGMAPAGEIRAGTLTIERAPVPSAGNRLVFGGGVRLMYQPEP